MEIDIKHACSFTGHRPERLDKNSISLEKIVQIGERVLMREMDVKCIKTTIIDEDKIILDVYREVDL